VAPPPEQKRISADNSAATGISCSNRRALIARTCDIPSIKIPYRMANRLTFNHPVRDLRDETSYTSPTTLAVLSDNRPYFSHKYTIFSSHFTAPFALIFYVPVYWI
jgi:hypothetical protein